MKCIQIVRNYTEINCRNYCTKSTKMIEPNTEIFQGMFDNIINFTPKEFYVKL